MARGCDRCAWGPSLVPKAVPSRVCVYGALRREVSGGGGSRHSVQLQLHGLSFPGWHRNRVKRERNQKTSI